MYKASLTNKTLEVLKLIATTQEQLGVSEIARAVSIHKSTVFGILRTLQQGAYVSKDSSTKKYTVGDELIRFSRIVSENKGLSHLARPLLEHLADTVDETVFLGICEGAVIKVIDVMKPRKSLALSSPVGTEMPITAGAPGKAYLSSLRDEEVLAILNERGLIPWTRASITDVGRFLEELEATRRQGYAIDREEYLPGVLGVAADITPHNRPMAVIWVAGFAASMDHAKTLQVAQSLVEAAQLIKQELASSNVQTTTEEHNHHAHPPLPRSRSGGRMSETMAPVLTHT